MKYCLVLGLAWISLLVHAQETAFVEKVNAATGIIEEYYVLKGDKSIKHGSYLKYKTGGIRILESGSYNNGQKDGIWISFYKFNNRNIHNIKEKGAYVNGKKNGIWAQYYMDSVEVAEPKIFDNKGKKKDSVVIDINQNPKKIRLVGGYLNNKRIGEWSSFDVNGNLTQKYNFSRRRLIFDNTVGDTLNYNSNRAPLFIGGQSLLNFFLAYEFDPNKAIPALKKDSVSIIISFVIHKDGRVDDYKIQKSSTIKELDNECIRIINLTDMLWIPAVSSMGEPIDDRYEIKTELVFENTSGKEKKYKIAFKSI